MRSVPRISGSISCRLRRNRRYGNSSAGTQRRGWPSFGHCPISRQLMRRQLKPAPYKRKSGLAQSQLHERLRSRRACCSCPR
jgi:hypothetical protein